jgi:hypothetical protein
VAHSHFSAFTTILALCVSTCFLAPAIERWISALILVSVGTTFSTDKC